LFHKKGKSITLNYKSLITSNSPVLSPFGQVWKFNSENELFFSSENSTFDISEIMLERAKSHSGLVF